MRIGVDVGGTNTDAVLMEGVNVLAAVKRPTSADVLTGIQEALAALGGSPNFDAKCIEAVMLGTTHFTNAVVSMKGLSPTAVIRLSLPSSSGVPPMVDWPEALANVLGRHVYEIAGGHEFSGREIAELDIETLASIAADIEIKGLTAIAITGVFSPLKVEHELAARDYLRQRLPHTRISVSHEIGRVGLIERENATIINASLLELAAKATDAFKGALADSGITAPLYLSQNDGTLMDVEFAKRFPVTTFSSGPTNSMRGAALLSGLKDCIVIDIGGTTADIGVLVGGFPRQATAVVDIGGVRTNFRMPDLLPMGIGGGSLVDLHSGDVGPASVGYRLATEALVFGGSTLTASDIAVAAGIIDIGDKTKVAHLDHARVSAALHNIRERIATTADMMRVSREALPVVLVGGGSILIDGDLPGLGPVIRPPYADCANAVGAAIAQIGAEVDRVVTLEGKDRAAELAAISDEARQQVEAAGAIASSIEIVEMDEVPIAYLPNDCVRVRVKAVGDLALGGLRQGAAA